EVCRSVSISCLESLKINIADSVPGSGSDDLFVNFILPQANSVATYGNRVDVSFNSYNCVIEIASIISSKILKGWDEVSKENSSICSPGYGIFEDAYRILLGSKKTINTEVVMCQC